MIVKLFFIIGLGATFSFYASGNDAFFEPKLITLKQAITVGTVNRKPSSVVRTLSPEKAVFGEIWIQIQNCVVSLELPAQIDPGGKIDPICQSTTLLAGAQIQIQKMRMENGIYILGKIPAVHVQCPLVLPGTQVSTQIHCTGSQNARPSLSDWIEKTEAYFQWL